MAGERKTTRYTEQLAREILGKGAERTPPRLTGASTPPGSTTYQSEIRLLPRTPGDLGDVLQMGLNGDGDLVPVWEPGTAALDVTDGTTTVTTPGTLAFDPAAFDVTESPAGTAHVALVGGGGAIELDEGGAPVVAALSTLDFDASDFNAADAGSGRGTVALNYGTGAGQPAEGNHTHASTLAADTHAATAKATPVDADELPLADSSASFALKKLTWANLKATAKAYFDTLYAAVSHAHTSAAITDFTEAAQDAIGAALVDGTGIDFTYDDGAGAITAEPIFGGTGSAGTVAHSDHTHAASPADVLTTKGDLLTRAAAAYARLPVGGDGQVLTADAAQTEGIKWDAARLVTKLDTATYNAGTAHYDFHGNAAGGTNVTWELASATDEVDVGLKRGSEHYNVPFGDHAHTGGAAGINRGAYASRPAAGNAGNIYAATDAPWLYLDDGAAWRMHGPLRPVGTEAVDSGWSWTNQGGASVDTSLGGIRLIVPNSAGNNWRIREKAYPATPFTLTIFGIANFAMVSFWSAGIVARDSASGRFVTCELGHSTQFVRAGKWTNLTTFLAAYTTLTNLPMSGFPFSLRYADDGTTRTFSYSIDGVTYTVISTAGSTDFVTPDKLGFGANINNASGATGDFWILAWEV